MSNLILLFLCQIFSHELLIKYNKEDEKYINDKSIKGKYLMDPSLKKGNMLVEHQGRSIKVESMNDLQKISDMLLNMSSPPEDISKIIKEIEKSSSDSIEQLKKGEKLFIIYFVDDSTCKIPIEHKEDGIMVFVSTDRKLAKSIGTSFPGMYGFNPEDKLSYTFPLNSDFKKNISIIKTPLFGNVTIQSLQLYKSTGLSLIYIFAFIENFEDLTRELFSEAKLFKDKVKLLLIPYVKEKTDLEYYGLEESNLPALLYLKNDEKYVKKDLTANNIKEFITQLISGKVEPYYASEKEPEDNEKRNVRIITRDNYDKYVVNNSTKDRLIVFSSDACHYCIQFKPVTEQLGRLFKDNKVEKVLIGECNISKNDVPIEISNVPAIYLFKANSNEKVIFSTKDRTLGNIVKFISEHGSHKVDLTKLVKEEELKGQKEAFKEQQNSKSERREL